MDPKQPLDQATAYYENGLKYKANGDVDAALTEFRRAILANPDYFDAHLQAGTIFRQKSITEPRLLQYAYDSLRKAIQINYDHEELQNQYMMVCQKMGRLDDLLKEYDEWLKANPHNEMLKKNRQNVFTISMAIMSGNSPNAKGPANPKLKKILLIMGGIGILMAAGLLMAPILLRNAEFMSKDLAKNLIRIGITSGILGLGIIIGRSFVK